MPQGANLAGEMGILKGEMVKNNGPVNQPGINIELEAHFNMGNALLRGGRFAEAIARYEEVLRLSPDTPEAHCNIGSALKELGKPGESIGSYQRAIRLRPDYADAFNNMGNLFQETGKLQHAAGCYQRAIDLDPGLAEAQSNMGNVLRDIGRIPEAISRCRRALLLKPDYSEAHSNLLLTMHYDPGIGQKELFFEARGWWRQQGKPCADTYDHGTRGHPDRRLRIGYVSPDFRRHSVSYFFLPLLMSHDPDEVETFCYAEVKRPDGMTARIKDSADHWRSIVGLSDDAVAEGVYKDGIDILVDLAGHTANSRLLVFARRPAPIQITWLGYPGTTGMEVMDYRLTDRIADPEGDADGYYSETLIRLDGGFLCYGRPEDAPPVSGLPALDKGGVTFGSFNNPAKINDKVVEVWSRILARAAGSILLLKGKSLADRSTRQLYSERFSRFGISPDRIEMLPGTPTTREHLSLYNRIDIGLDPFPYNGTTTTCEALWMGVPVLTLRGERHSSRVGTSILTRVGLEELISDSEGEYVSKGVRLAGDLKKLSQLRAGMRHRLKESPLCDGDAFARAVEGVFRKLIRERSSGDESTYQFHTGNMLRDEGRPGVALHDPERAETFYNSGLAHQLQGRLAEALNSYKKAVRIAPDHAGAFNNMGVALQDLGRFEEAFSCYKRAVQLRPDYVEALCNLGNAFQHQGRSDNAISCYEKALGFNPDLSEPNNNMGNVLMQKGELEKAISCYREAVRLGPKNAEAHCNLGNAFQYQGRFNDAVSWYKKAVQLRPNNTEAYNNMGAALKAIGRIDEAIISHQKALSLNPDNSEALNNLGNALKQQGGISEAIICYQRALALKPDYSEAHSNLLLTMHYDPGIGQKELFFEARGWWKQQGKPCADTYGHGTRCDPDRRLRIGYVSSDFRRHSVSYFFLPLLMSHDPDEVETFCYAEVKRPDGMTARIKDSADHWRPIVGLSDDAVAKGVYEDGIDILVDLAGHTANSRLLVFARRPAPIQVTWLGYPGTTGMEVMDYRLTDRIADPEGEADGYYSETLIRLNGGFLCYGPPEDAPPVSGLPALDKGGVTFGSFNNPAKINDKVIDVWSRILARVPGSILMLKGKSLADKNTRRLYSERFSRFGISPDRIEMLPGTPTTREHLSLYNRVDIGLDPFPYNGATTTCEALWMGVPVLTLRGDRHSSRVGASILTRVGLQELISDSEEEYVSKGVRLAGDLKKLSQLRAGMRHRLRESPLCHGESFARCIEGGYREIWRRWAKPREEHGHKH